VRDTAGHAGSAFRLLLPMACALTKARPRAAVVVTVVLAGPPFDHGVYLLDPVPIAPVGRGGTLKAGSGVVGGLLVRVRRLQTELLDEPLVELDRSADPADGR
jgi:hypothetical protein